MIDYSYKIISSTDGMPTQYMLSKLLLHKKAFHRKITRISLQIPRALVSYRLINSFCAFILSKIK